MMIVQMEIKYYQFSRSKVAYACKLYPHKNPKVTDFDS